MTSSETSKASAPTKTIRSDECVESPYLQVMQVLDEGILAYLCPVKAEYPYKDVFEGCWVKGDLVYMSVPPKDNHFVDDQKVTLPDDICFVQNGTYRYHTKDNIKKTIRKIAVVESQVPNPAYKEKKQP